MEETEYKDNEKVLYKTRFNLNLPPKSPEEIDCLITQEHVIIETEEPIKIPVSQISCDIPSYPSPQYTARSQETYSDDATIEFTDEQGKEGKISLKGAFGSLHSFKKIIDMVNELSWLLEDLKKLQWQAEIVDDNTVKIMGQKIDRIRLYDLYYSYNTDIDEGEYLGSIIYTMHTEILQKDKNLAAETYVGATGVRWMGGALAYYLNGDMELLKLLERARQTNIKIKAYRKQQRVDIWVSPPTPTSNNLEILDRIVKNIRKVATEVVITVAVSNRERLGARGSILRRIKPILKSGYFVTMFGMFIPAMIGVFGYSMWSQQGKVWGMVLVVIAALIIAFAIYAMFKFKIEWPSI